MSPRLRHVLCVALVLALLAPAVAIAQPGNGKGQGNAGAAEIGQGKGKPGKALESEPAELPEGEAPELDPKAAKQAAREERKAAKRLEKEARKAGKSGSLDASLETSPTEGSEETSPTVKKTGIANALEHVQANLERAAERGKLPPGLVQVVNKFLSWLGLTPDDGGAEGEDPGSDETSPTVPPSDETSPVVPPSDPASDTVLPDPGLDDAPLVY